MAVQINVAANQAALVQSIQAGVQAYNQRFANQNPINLQVNARAFSQPLGRITGDVKDFEAALAASNARVIAFGASTAVLGGVLRGFRSIAEVTIEVEKNLADINRVFGLTTKELQKFSTDLFNVSKQTASSFGDASKAALEFSRQGVKAEEVLQRTADAMTLARLAGMNVNNAIEALTATVNGFQATGITTTQVLNKLVAVEQSYAVSAGDLAEALSRTGLAAQEAGVNIDQLNALVTAAQEKTARGGAVIGNALKTIFTRLQRTETLDQLEAFNIGVRDIQGNILPAVQILQNFASAYNTLADSQRAQLSEQVAGVYQVNILKAIIGDLNNKQGAYAGALQKGAMATNEAQIAAAKLNQTLDALLSQTSTVAQQFANNVGKVTFEPLAKYTAESFKSLFENLNEILEGEGVGSTFANGLLKGIRNVLAGPGAIGAFFVLFKLIQNSFAYLTQALPQIVGITTETQNRKNIEQAILQIMQQQGPVAQALAGQMGNQTAQAQLLLQLARQQTAEYQRQQALVAALAPALSAQGVSARGQQGLRVTRSGGYIPKEAKLQETIGALAGGYTPGQVIKSPVGGVMNSAEQVKYMPGFAQPFINPPANSDAGRTHRRNSINKTGVDPYMNNGFIPNFYISSTDKKRVQSAKIIEGNLFEKELYTKLDTGTEPPGATLDFPTGKLESVRSKNRQTTLSVGIDDQTLYGDAKLSLNSSNITSMISKYIRAGNKFIIGDTLFDDKNYSILYKYGPPDNLLTNKTRKLSSLLKHNPSLINNIAHRLIDMRTGNRLNKAGENTKIGLTFFGDKVDIGQTSASGFIPNLASSQLPVEYRNPITGKLNNPKIAAAIRMGKLDPAVAMAAGYKTSSQSIQERKQGVLERVFSSGFKRIGISGIGTLPSNTTFSQTNPFAKNFESLALKKAQQMFGSNNIVFASNYEKGGRKFKGAPTNTAIDALEDNLTGPVIEMKSGDTTPDAALRKKFTQGKNELIEMWHNAMPDKKIDSIVQSIGARPEYLFYNADKEVKRGTEQIIQASTGFIPNFAAIDRNILRDMIKFNIANASSSTKGLKNVELSRSVRGRGKRWQSLSEQYNKNIPENEIINAVFASRYQETGNAFFEKRFMQQSIEDTIERHQSDVPDFSGGENFKKSPFVSTSLKKSSAFAHASITGGEIIKQQKVRLSRILNKQAYSLLIDKYGEEKVKETILNLSKLKGGKGIGFDVNDFLKTHYDIIRSKGKVAYRESENEVAILSKGFIPNFAADYINKVMNLESNMSGNKAILDTQSGPFPFIRNSSQPNFAAAISDHGGMNKALNDSYKNQVAAGLMNKGFVPNFAPFDITGTSLQRSAGGAVSHKKINKAINDYINSINLSTTSNKDISDALTKLLPQFNLNQQSFNEVRRAAIDYAKAQKAAAQQTQQQTQQNSASSTSRLGRLSSGLSRAGTAISIAGPTIAGFAEQAFFGNKERIDMTRGERIGKEAVGQGLSAITTGAGIGSAFGGLPGALLGGFVGGLVGLTSALNAAELSTEELNKKLEKQIQAGSENISAAQKYIEAQKALSALITSGASQKEIDTASKAVADSFKEIKNVDLAKSLLETKGGVEALNNVLAPFQKKQKATEELSNLIATPDKQFSQNLFKFLSEKGQNSLIQSISSGFFSKTPEEYFGAGSQGARMAYIPNMLEQGKTFQQLQYTEQNRIIDAIISSVDSSIDEEAKTGLKQKLKQFLSESKNSKELTDQFTQLIEIANQFTNDQINITRKSANFYEARNQAELENIVALSKVESELRTSEFSQKFADKLFEFQYRLSESFISPLQRINSKLEFESKQLEIKTEDAIKKLNKDLIEKNFTELGKKVLSQDLYEGEFKPAVDAALQGDFSQLQNILTGGGSAYSPEFIKILQEELKNREEQIKRIRENQKNEQNLLNKDANLNTVKERYAQIMNNLIIQDIELTGRKERLEMERKANLELELDRLSRRETDPAEFFGLSVLGEADKKSMLMREKSAQRIADIETSNVENARKASLDVINMRRQQLLDQAQFMESQGLPSDYFKTQAESLTGDNFTIDKAIRDLESRRFVNNEQDKQRVQTLERLRDIQKQINIEKAKEATLTERNTADLQRDAQRAISFRYGLESSFDKMNKEADTIGRRLGEQIPTAFADGMTNALMEVAKGTKSIGDAFTDMAINFGQMLMQEVMRAAIGKVIGSAGLAIMGSQTGGIIGKQRGGIIRAENGTYIPGNRTGDRNLALLEDGEYVLNREAVAAIGVNNLDGLNYGMAPRFQSGGGFGFAAQQSLIGDELNYSGNLIGSGMDTRPVSLDDYSAYAFESDPFFKNMRQKSIETEKERVNKEFQAKQKRAQLISSIVGGIGAIALGQGLGNLGSLKLSPKGVGKGVDAPPSGPINFSSNPKIMAQRGGLIGYQSGGFIPYGSRISDNVPRYMSGGMNAISNAANNKYISANSSRMQGGGSNSTTNNTNNTNNSNINIVANVGSYNKSGQFVLGQSGNNYDSNEMIFSQNLARNIAKVADNQIQKANRYGGFNKQSYV